MTDKIQDRLLKVSRYEVRKEAADCIDKLEQQRDELAAALSYISTAKYYTDVELQDIATKALLQRAIQRRRTGFRMAGETSDNRAKENDDD